MTRLKNKLHEEEIILFVKKYMSFFKITERIHIYIYSFLTHLAFGLSAKAKSIIH